MREGLNFHIDVSYGKNGIRRVSLFPSAQGFIWTFSADQKDLNIEKRVHDWMESYYDKKQPAVSLPYDWSLVTPFTRQVLEKVECIPFGQILSYGQVADRLGRPEAARAVGGACGRNPFLLFIPCHRVLDANFELRGYSAGGLSVKKALLDFERG